MKPMTAEDARRFVSKINELRARRNKLFVLGLTIQRDMVAFDAMMNAANDDNVTVDEFLAVVEKHVAKMESEFMS